MTIKSFSESSSPFFQKVIFSYPKLLDRWKDALKQAKGDPRSWPL
jgi:hypothetical protein